MFLLLFCFVVFVILEFGDPKSTPTHFWGSDIDRTWFKPPAHTKSSGQMFTFFTVTWDTSWASQRSEVIYSIPNQNRHLVTGCWWFHMLWDSYPPKKSGLHDPVLKRRVYFVFQIISSQPTTNGACSHGSLHNRLKSLFCEVSVGLLSEPGWHISGSYWYLDLKCAGDTICEYFVFLFWTIYII